MPKLIATGGPMQGREYDIDEPCILGRSPSCQIYLGDLSVSRQHARLVRADLGDTYRVEDLGSSNGTWVNATRITAPHTLQDGDEIRIASSVFRFVADAPPAHRWGSVVTVIAHSDDELIATGGGIRTPTRMPDAALDARSLQEELVRAHRMLDTLYAVSDATSSILEPGELFDTVLDYLLGVFPGARRGYVMLMENDGQLVPGAIRRQSGERADDTNELVVSQALVNQVLQEGRSVRSNPEQGRSSSGYGPPSPGMCAPLFAQGRTLGILYLDGAAGGNPFTQNDLDLLTGIARQAGVAMLNASLHTELLHKQRLEQDLRIARQVQQSFLPLEPPQVPGYSFDCRYRPFFDVGGDIYDFIGMPGGRIGVLIGDVSGKGVSAALVMARLSSDLRSFAITEEQPAQVLERTNQSLISRIQDNMFATVLYLVLDLGSNTMTFSNAGHLPPLLRRGGQVVELEQATSIALGVLPNPGFEQYTIQLSPWDIVLLCTDGTVESKSAEQEEYGMARLKQALAAAPLTHVLKYIDSDIRQFCGTASQYDDTTLVSFHRLD